MIYKSLMDIADNFDTFFFDAWGVFNIGGNISKSAIDVMAELVKRGKSVSIMSNTPQYADGAIQHYAKRGIKMGVHFQNFFCSGQTCRDVLMAHNLPVSGKTYYRAWDNSNNPAVVNDSYDLFRGTDYVQMEDVNDVDFIYLDFPTHNQWLVQDIKILEPEINKIVKSGKTVVSANPDEFVFFDGEFYFMQGSIVTELEKRGVKVISYGKPYPEIYIDAMNKLGRPDSSRTVMIGDTLHTDILGATRAGIKSCLTVSCGITERDLKLVGLEVNEENIRASADKIGARVDYIIERVPSVDL